MNHPVALARCPSYEQALVDGAVRSAVSLAGGFEPRGKRVLLKPNMLRASEPDAAVTTHPAVLRAVIRLARELGAASIAVGDSPAFQSGDAVGDKSGLKAAALEEGAAWVDFSDAVEIDVPDARLFKRFPVARAVLDADLVVSLPKLKTHGLAYFTGAIKNMYGVIPGLNKASYHLRFPGRAEFAAALLDILGAAKVSYAIMDGVVGMEGPGPNHGTPRHVGLVLASPNPCALDWSAASLIGYDPKTIPHLSQAVERGLVAPDAIELRGLRFDEARAHGYQLIPIQGDREFLGGFVPKSLRPFVHNLVWPRPFFSKARCTACGGCVKICAAGALSIERSRGQKPHVAIDRDKCIRCYCCDEICPSNAIKLSRFPW